jgi:hypothetical protein
MRLTTTFDHFGLPRIRHLKVHGHPAVFIEGSAEHHHGVAHPGQERWRAASYRDPWPDRA